MRRLALEAGDRIMEVYDGPDFEVRAKGDASPVTEADEAADAVISAGLRAAFPDVPLITEEQADSHALTARDLPDRRSAGRHQGIRPAARRFHREHRLCRRTACPSRGVVYAPAQGRLFYTLPDGTCGRGDRAPSTRTAPGPTATAPRLHARQCRADGRGLEIAPRCRRRMTTSPLCRARHDQRRLQPEVLPGGHRRGGPLPPAWPHDGMGHGGRRCRAARGGRACGALRRPHSRWPMASPAGTIRSSSPMRPGWC